VRRSKCKHGWRKILELAASYRANSGFSGRPRGSRNKLGEVFIAALAQDFEAHGASAIAKCREKFPGKAQILPKEIDLALKADISHHIELRQFVADYRTVKDARERLASRSP